MRPKTFINAAPTIHVDAPPVRYTLALGAAAAAVLVRAALSPLLGSWQPFLTIYPAVLLVALRCGWRPASATLAVSLPLCVALFVDVPIVRLASASGAELPTLMTTMTTTVIGAAIIALADAHRRARLHAAGLAAHARRIADSLRHSEQRFRAIFQQAAVGIGHLDLEGRWTLANQRLSDLLGVPREDLLGRSMLDAVHPDEREATADALRRLAAGEIATHDADLRLLRPDGATIWLHTTTSYLAGGGVQGPSLALVAKDITPRKAALQALERTTRRMEVLATTAGELLRNDDPRAFLDDLFGRLAGFLGLEVYIHYEFDEPTGSLRLVAHGGIDEPTAALIATLRPGEGICGAAAQTRTPVIIHDAQRSTDPRTAFIRSLGLTAYACHPLVARGRLMGTLAFGTRNGTAFDAEALALLRTVSDQVAIAIERERTRAQLADRDERLRFAHAAAGAGSWEWNPDTGESVLTPEAADLLGVRTDGEVRLTDERFIALLHPEDRERVARRLREVAERSLDFDMQYRILHPARGLRWMHSLGRAEPRAGGGAARVAGLLLDITDRKLVEESLRFLADAGGVLAASLDYRAALSRIAEMAVPRFADWCVVDLAGRHARPERLALAHANADKARLAAEVLSRCPRAIDAGPAEVIRTGRPQLIREVTDDLLARVVRDPEQARLLRGLGVRSYICVPLIARGRILGAITFASAESARRYGRGDLATAGELAARAAVAIDNADLYLAQQQSEQMYRTLVEQVRDYAIFRTDLAGRPTSWNVGVKRVLGFDEEEFLGADINPVIFPPEDLAAGVVAAELSEAAAAGSAGNDRWMRRKNGERFWAMGTVSGLYDDSGALVGYTRVMRDQTEWKAAMDALSESEQRKTAILEASLDAIITMDEDGRIVEFNPAAERTFGYPRNDVIGRTVAETIIPPHLREAHNDGLRRYRQTGVGAVIGRRTEWTAVRADGSQFPIELSISPVRLPSGRRLFTATIRDITDRKRAEAELARHRDHLQEILAERTAELDASHQKLRLSERLAALGTLAAGLGHDMGNLLLPLRMRLESVEAEIADESARADLAAIRKATEYLQRLTHGLRLLAVDPDEAQARGGSAGTELHEWWPDAEPLLRNALPGNITLHSRLAGGRLAVTLARPGLTQAIFNLVQNAGQALRDRPDGEVTVWAEPGDPGPDGRATIRIGVTDNGPGMPPEVVSRCLEPFFTTRTRTHATGMGLSLVNAAVQKAGGTLEVRSEVGKGATFILSLPAAPEPGAGPPVQRPSVAVSLRDPRMTSFVHSLLASMDFDPHAGKPRPDDCMWIADADSAGDGGLSDFLNQAPGRRIILFGDHPADLRDDDRRVVRIPGRSGPRAIREAIHAVAPSFPTHASHHAPRASAGRDAP